MKTKFAQAAPEQGEAISRADVTKIDELNRRPIARSSSGLSGAPRSGPAREATAYAHRDTEYVMNVHGRWETAAEDEHCVKWCRDYFQATAPFASSGVYLNFMTADELDRVRSAYGASYVENVWPELDWEKAYRGFYAEYAPYCAVGKLGPTRAPERASRCVVETGTATFYATLAKAAPEPILAELASRIKDDENRHYNLFLYHYGCWAAQEGRGRGVTPAVLRARMGELNREDIYLYLLAVAGQLGGLARPGERTCQYAPEGLGGERGLERSRSLAPANGQRDIAAAGVAQRLGPFGLAMAHQPQLGGGLPDRGRVMLSNHRMSPTSLPGLAKSAVGLQEDAVGTPAGERELGPAAVNRNTHSEGIPLCLDPVSRPLRGFVRGLSL